MYRETYFLHFCINNNDTFGLGQNNSRSKQNGTSIQLEIIGFQYFN